MSPLPVRFAVPLLLGALWSGVHRAPRSAPAFPTPAQLQDAIARSVPLLQASADTWFEQRSCSSCHHQGLGTMAMAVIHEQGFAIDSVRLRAQAVRTMRPLPNWHERYVLADVSINQSIGQTYRAIGAASAGHPASDAMRAVSHLTAGQQHASGRWSSNSRRPPLEDSEVTATALGIRTLALLPLPHREAEFARRIASARAWLLVMQPTSTEERVMQLLGSAWGGADSAALASHARALLAEQRADGGWAQVATRASDAYATGQAVVALQQAAGVSMRDARLARALSFLLESQHVDGSWHVPTTRTMQFGLPYFESGYPHGKDQFISYAGGAWATMALALATHDARSEIFMGTPRVSIALAPDTVPDGLTPLQRAAMYGTVEDMRALLASGASVHDTSVQRTTALMAAVHDVEKVRVLLDAGADANVESRSGQTALQLAAQHSGASASARLLLERGAVQERAIRTANGARVTAFTFALIRGDTLLAQAMLDRGANVNGPENASISPLMAATWHADANAARWLLARGALVDDRPGEADRAAATPLMVAAEDGLTDVVMVLLAYGAKVQATDRGGLTALHHAAAAPDRGHLRILDALLAAGADRGAQSVREETPAALARRFGKVAAAERLER